TNRLSAPTILGHWPAPAQSNSWTSSAVRCHHLERRRLSRKRPVGLTKLKLRRRHFCLETMSFYRMYEILASRKIADGWLSCGLICGLIGFGSLRPSGNALLLQRLEENSMSKSDFLYAGFKVLGVFFAITATARLGQAIYYVAILPSLRSGALADS